MNTNKKALKHVKKLAEQYEQTAKDLCKAVEAAYPLGTRVLAKCGQHYIRGFVTAHCNCWWHEPGAMLIRNEQTNNTRRVNPAERSAYVEILSLPADV